MTQKEKELYGNSVKFALVKLKMYISIIPLKVYWNTIVPMIVWYNKHTKQNRKIKISKDGDVYGDGSVIADTFDDFPF